MTATSNPDTADTRTDDFESALRTLVFESFANGATIQGAWEITSPSSVVPDWRITVEKLDSADPPRDEPAFLDE